jgi:plasmid stabilization system protein ParE
MLPIVWRPAARRNWHAIIDYVSDHSPQGANTLTTHLDQVLIHPNYILVYRSEAHQIRIINVLHSARRYPSP